MSIFLTQDDVVILTSKKKKSCQVAALRNMGIPFFVNASGRAVVLLSAIDGSNKVEPEKKWRPAVLSMRK